MESLRIKSNDGFEICALHVPEKKKMLLAVKRAENDYVHLATFKNEASAAYFMNYLADMLGAIEDDKGKDSISG